MKRGRLILSGYVYHRLKPVKWATGLEGLGADAEEFDSSAN